MPDPFVSVSDLEDYIGRTVVGDPAGTAVVDAACDVCRTVSEQTFNRGTTTATFDGPGTDALLLPELPVNSVSSVRVVTSGPPRVWTTAGSADYSLNGDGVLLATNTGGTAEWGEGWPTGRQNIEVTYDHGYDSDDLPRDVRMVALSLASRLIVQGVGVFEAIGDTQIRYAGAANDLTSTESMILRRHKRHR